MPMDKLTIRPGSFWAVFPKQGAFDPKDRIIWAYMNTAVETRCRIEQAVWDLQEEVVSARFHSNSGAICLHWERSFIHNWRNSLFWFWPKKDQLVHAWHLLATLDAWDCFLPLSLTLIPFHDSIAVAFSIFSKTIYNSLMKIITCSVSVTYEGRILFWENLLNNFIAIGNKLVLRNNLHTWNSQETLYIPDNMAPCDIFQHVTQREEDASHSFQLARGFRHRVLVHDLFLRMKKHIYTHTWVMKIMQAEKSLVSLSTKCAIKPVKYRQTTGWSAGCLFCCSYDLSRVSLSKYVLKYFDTLDLT